MSNDINKTKLIGGKRKNGHKANCDCHICENMTNKAKRGGYEEELEKEEERMMGGSKKKNGHRKDCTCPICKNMKNSKKRSGGKSNRRTKKRRGGDDENDEDYQDDTELDTDTDISDEEEEKGEQEEEDIENEEDDRKGGRKKKRSNGHKKDCKCPICKNMRKAKKGGDEPDEENQLGDIEEAGIKGSMVDNDLSSETKASTSDYDALDAAERGEAGQNVVGGSRKRRRGGKKRGGKKWGGKTRKVRRSRRRH